MSGARSPSSGEPTLVVVAVVLVLALVAAVAAGSIVLRPRTSAATAAVERETEEVRPGPGTTLSQARGLHLYLVPHPDDELSGWTSLTDGEDLYPVLLVLTRGGDTVRCTPERFEQNLQPELGEVTPQPRPDQDGSPQACREARLSSFRAVLAEAGPTSADVAGLGEADLVDLPGGSGGTYAVLDNAALVVLDLADGQLTQQAVGVAVDDVLAALEPELGGLELTRVTASAYATDGGEPPDERCDRPALCPSDDAPYPYPHEDHRVVREATRALAGRTTEGSWLVTSPYDPLASVFRALPQDVYDEFLALGPGEDEEAERLGSYQRHYGWLAFPKVWRRGDLPLESTDVIFSRVQSFEVVAP